MKTSPKRSYSVIENERFGFVFVKTVSIISGTGLLKRSTNTGSEYERFGLVFTKKRVYKIGHGSVKGVDTFNK